MSEAFWKNGGVDERVEDSPGDEATDVVRTGTILRNLVMERRRERNRWGGVENCWVFCLFLVREDIRERQWLKTHEGERMGLLLVEVQDMKHV